MAVAEVAAAKEQFSGRLTVGAVVDAALEALAVGPAATERGGSSSGGRGSGAGSAGAVVPVGRGDASVVGRALTTAPRLAFPSGRLRDVSILCAPVNLDRRGGSRGVGPQRGGLSEGGAQAATQEQQVARSPGLSLAAALSGVLEVDLDGNGLASFADLLALPRLKTLKLNHNRVASLRPGAAAGTGTDSRSGGGGGGSLGGSGGGGAVDFFARLPGSRSLEALLLGFNRVSDATLLELPRLPSLRVLHLQGNLLADLAGLGGSSSVNGGGSVAGSAGTGGGFDDDVYVPSGCGGLRELVLSKNKLRSLAPSGALAGLGQGGLVELHLQENGLRSLGALGLLGESLVTLHLGGNRVAELGDLALLRPLAKLASASLAANPIARKPLYRASLLAQLPAVRWIDGIEVGK